MRASEPESPAARLVALLTLAIAALLLVLAFVPAADNSTGLPHPALPGMLQGGDGGQRHAHLLAYGWTFGALQIALLAAMVMLGARRPDGFRGLLAPLLAWNLLYLAIWSAILVAYRFELANPSARVGGLTPSSAVLVYGLWPLPACYAWLYARGFRRWIFTSEDEAVFDRLVQQNRQRRDQAPD